MDTHDYVQFIEKPTQPPLDLGMIPKAGQLAAMHVELEAITNQVLDLKGLEAVGPLDAPANPEELKRSRTLVDLVEEVPELADVAKVPRALLKDAYELDMRTLRLTAASADLRQQTQLGERFALAKLTEHNDRVEDAVTALIVDAAVPEAERRAIRYTFTFPGYARAWEQGRQAARQQRRDLRQRRLQEQLGAIDQATEAERRRLRLLAADLPLAPVKKKTKSKTPA